MSLHDAAFFLCCALAIGAVVYGRVRRVVVPQVGEWRSTPTVYCDRRLRDSVREAIAWWGERGHPLMLLDHEAGARVTIRLDPELADRGDTKCWTDGDNVVSAQCVVRSEDDIVAVAHEIGHALGYLHPIAAPSGHLMHPSRPGMGWGSDRGLRGSQSPSA